MNSPETSASSPNVESQATKWNLMVYMAADNSLSEECVYALKEMRRIGTAPNVEVLTQFHSSAKGHDGKPLAPRRFKVRKQNPGKDEDGDLQDQTPNQGLTLAGSPSDPNTLTDFLFAGLSVEGALNAKQFLILSGHGSGAIGPFLKSNNQVNSLGVPQLTEVLKDLPRKVDILLMDSCLMSMAEVAHAVSFSMEGTNNGAEIQRVPLNQVDFLIAAEGYELSTGWPYHRILELLNDSKESGAETKTLAGNLVNKYMRYYSDYDIAGVSVDEALFDLQRTGSLADAVKSLKTALINAIAPENAPALNLVLLAHWRAQSYHGERYVDLWDFCDQLQAYLVKGDALYTACQRVKDVIKGNASEGVSPFVLQSCYSGAAFQHSHGVSIYFPWAADTQNVGDFEDLIEYKKLGFHQDTGWGDFIQLYLEKSRREERLPRDLTGKTLQCFIPTDDTRVGIRLVDPGSKGGDNKPVKVKNMPVSFYREDY